MERRNHPLKRIVKERGRDADFVGKFELMSGTEERLVLSDGLCFIVQNRPTRADPAGCDDRALWIGQIERAWFGLDFLLNLAAESIGIAEVDLYFARGAAVRFPRDGRREYRLPLGGIGWVVGNGLAESIQIVHDARGSGSEQAGSEGKRIRIVDKALNVRRRQINAECREGVAAFGDTAANFSFNCRPYHQPQRVETHLGLILIGIENQSRLQNTVIVLCRDGISERILPLLEKQVVRIIAEPRVLPEWIAQCRGR